MSEMETFWQIVYKIKGDDSEVIEDYDDYEDARADYIHMTEGYIDDYEYVVWNKVVTNYEDYENITEEDSWYSEE